MSADLLGLFEAKGLAPKKKTLGEWSAPCPSCGGKDRCMVRPDDHDGRGGYWCRKCGAYGDAIQFLRDYEGLDYHEACRRLGVAAARTASSLPRPPRPAVGQDPFEAAPSEPPAEAWTKKATAFAAWAHQHLLANPRQLEWLAARGLPLEAVEHYRLGWNPGEKGRSCLIRPRSAWGLPPVEAKPDKDGKPGKPKTTFWIPRGLVIPQLATADPDSPVLRLRIRRPDEDRREFKEDTKYYVIPGSSMDAMLLGADAQAFVVVESELDALMLHHQAGDLAGAVSVMTANVKKLAAHVHAALARALCILVALDAEGAGGAGAKGWLRWPASFPRAKRWPCPVGKDPGEAFERGANLPAWILAGLPPVLQPGLLPPGQPALAGGGEAEKAVAKPEVAAGEDAVAGPRAPETVQPPATPAPVAAATPVAGAPGLETDSVPAAPAALAVPWLDPDYVTALGMVPLTELVAAMDRHGVAPVLVAGLVTDTERVLALRSAADVPEAAGARIAELFFGPCLEAVLWFFALKGARGPRSLAGVFGREERGGEWAAIVRRAGDDDVGLTFGGWTNLNQWRGREAAGT
uniref:DNA primase n=1 Tax=Desulfovibrio sp. U5L TaxID=596152 RepID=I2Q2R2_9BACT